MRTYSHYLSTLSGTTLYAENGVLKTFNLPAIPATAPTKLLTSGTYLPPNAGLLINGNVTPITAVSAFGSSTNYTGFFPSATSLVIKSTTLPNVLLIYFMVNGILNQILANVLPVATITATYNETYDEELEPDGFATLTVSAINAGGALSVGQYIQLGASLIVEIVSFGTGTGGVGTYTIKPEPASIINNNIVPTSYTTLPSYSLKIPVTPNLKPSLFNAFYSILYTLPYAVTTLANTICPIYTFSNPQIYAMKFSPFPQLKLSVNWKEIFGDKTVGECRLRVKLISNASTPILLPFTSSVGSLRASFASNTCSSTNGYNIGSVKPVTQFLTSSSTVLTYLECDTTTTLGSSILIPNTNGDFTITFLNSSETIMSNVPDYQIWFYFDVD